MLAGQGISALLLLVGVLQTDLLSFVGLRQLVEERKLLGEFGEQYAQYRAATPILMPGFRFRGNK